MFGMGFTEIILIAIIAIIALGPEKLPGAMVEIAKFFKKFKSGIEDAKSTLDNELQLSSMKEEAEKFHQQLDSAKASVSLDNIENLVSDEPKEEKKEKAEPVKPKEPKIKREKVSFKNKETQSKDA
jgi:sec-independent protein translocase protein TatB